jgi:predicted CxxxxCH...CXXCH cytochrome family protein
VLGYPGGVGVAGRVGSTGGTTGSGGLTGSGGVTLTGTGGAKGGTTGSGGAVSTGGTTGTGGAGGAGGTAATFTQVFAILQANCSGTSCHNPGSQQGVSFANITSAYSAVSKRVTAGNATGSTFYKLVNGGGMPPGGKLSATDLATLASWINAGAMNN